MIAIAAILSLTAVARAQSGAESMSVTEVRVVALAVERAPLVEVLEGTVAEETGRARAAGAYTNPQILYTREQTYGEAGTGEDYLSVAQTFDLGNRRGLRRRASERRVRATELDGDAERLVVATEARLRFYEVLYRQRRVTALETWAAHVSEVLSIVARREARGDVATYDRRRFERELSIANGRLVTERAALEGAKARLGAIVGTAGPTLIAEGTLLPDSDPPDLPALRASSATRADRLSLDLQIEAAALETRAASRWWLPDLRLEAGWKGIGFAAGGRSDGFLFGASLSLPLWDRSSGLTMETEARARVARGRLELLDAQIASELAGARAETVMLRHGALDFRERSTSSSTDLIRMTSLGYEQGELGVLELLDAYRGSVEDELVALDMEQAARRARVELDRLTGAGVPR